MKIITMCLIDMLTGETLAENSFEHSGPVDLCGGGGKGGGGSSTTNISSEPDREYNARMAAVAERQQSMSDQFYDWWKSVQAPVEEATAQAQLSLLPQQTELTREFYKSAMPVSAEAMSGQAVADANMALGKAAQTMSRNMSRMGINPNSGAAQAGFRDLALGSAAAMAGAANQGRMQADEYNLKKLATAM